MTATQSFYTYNQQLKNCRLCSNVNLAATYFNGDNNNGVGATLIGISVGALTIDSVIVNIGDDILLNSQTQSSQNGIYTVINNGTASSPFVLQRRVDFQSIEQVKEGQFVVISSGAAIGGSFFVLTEPLPLVLGINPITFISNILGGTGTAASKNASNNALPTVSSVSGATITNDVLVSADIAGTLKDGGYYMHGANAIIAGGSATATITDALITTTSIMTFSFQSLTNPATVIGYTTAAGSVLVTFNIDPGASVLSYILMSNPV